LQRRLKSPSCRQRTRPPCASRPDAPPPPAPPAPHRAPRAVTAEPGRKWQATSCRAPIGQITCKINADGFVEGIQYGPWGPITGYTPAPFLPGGGSLWYTQSWCGAFGLQNRCSGGGTTDAVITMPNTWNGGNPPTATATFVKGMTVCYGKKEIRGITWNLQQFTVGWVQGAANAVPQAVVTPGATSVQTCGVTTGCKMESTYNAPDNKVLGGIETKCKLTQGWFKYVSNGQYHNRLFIDKIDKVCLTDRECPGRPRGREGRGAEQRGAAACALPPTQPPNPLALPARSPPPHPPAAPCSHAPPHRPLRSVPRVPGGRRPQQR
jgi:hypothetical protein